MKVLDNITYAHKMIWRTSHMIYYVMLLWILLSSIKTIISLFFVRDIINFVLSDTFTYNNLFSMLLFFLVVTIALEMFDKLVMEIIINKFETVLVGRIKGELYKKIENVDIMEYCNPNFYDKIDKAFRESEVQYFKVFSICYVCLMNILTMIIVNAFYFDWFLIVATVINVINYMVYYYISNKKKYLFDKNHEPYFRFEDYLNRVFYNPKYAQELRMFNYIDKKLHSKLDEKSDYYYIDYKGYLKTFSKNSFIVSSISNCIFAVFGVYISMKVYNKSLNTGDFIIALSVITTFSNQLINVFKIIPELYTSGLAIGDIREILNYKSKLISSDKCEINDFEEITAENISFMYNENMDFSLKNVSFSIKRGQVVAIVGLNGSGKTTLLDLIMRLMDPLVGCMYLNKQKYSDYSIEKVRKTFSVVFQNINLYEISIAENILLKEVNSETDIEKINEALEFVNMYEKVMSLKDGIHTCISNDIGSSDFSGGERQKLAIARAFVQNSPVMILDEPTSSMDVFSEKKFFESLYSLRNKKNKTIIFTTHRLEYTVHADNILLLKNGEIIESGTHERLMSLGKEYASLYNMNLQHKSFI